VGFGPDASHVAFFNDDPPELRPYDLDKNAYTGVRLPMLAWASATSSDGHYLAYLETDGDGAPLHVRDLVANKDVSQWTGNFHSVEALAVSNDGKTVATGSYNSLRLWDVAQKKQLFKHETGSRLKGTTESRETDEYAFSDDGKTMVLAGDGVATAWDVATGTEKPLVVDATQENVLRVVPAPDGGVAIVAEGEVHVVPRTGEPRVVCKGMWQPYAPVIGPTHVAFSTSGKSFACVMSDGWAHVFDTSNWAERAVIKRGAASPLARPVDLVFSADEKKLTIVSNAGFIAYDAATGAELEREALRHPKALGFMARHARFDDGSIAVRLWNGSAAIFDETGAWKRDVKLVAGAPADALDAFASSGATYAVALGKTVHVVDLATGDDHPSELASAPKSLAVSADGKTVLVALGDGTVSAISGGAVTPLAHAKGTRVGFAGKSMLVWAEKDVLDAYAPGATSPLELVLDEAGVVVQNDAGAFEARGKPYVACSVGKTFLSRETCGDRAKEGLVADWLRAAR
jgi:DNA-binding beta-propeller fold protein YncE